MHISHQKHQYKNIKDIAQRQSDAGQQINGDIAEKVIAGLIPNLLDDIAFFRFCISQFYPQIYNGHEIQCNKN